ncbi:MAG TPA: CpXC domain-containing protein [Candidatus Binatia bacterium]
MSRCEIQQVACPKCGATQEEKVFVSVNGARIKAAADLIIDGSWGELECLKCGARYHRDTPMLFTDLPGGLWIVQYDRSQRRRFAHLEDEANQIFEREFVQRPPAAIRRQALAVKRRICFGRRQLAEKLLARRHGIDDRALECLKLVLLRDYLGELFQFGPTEFVLQRVEPEQLRLIAVPIDEPRSVLDVTVRIERLQAIAQDEDSFRKPFAELFSKLYVNATRYFCDDAAVPGAGAAS